MSLIKEILISMRPSQWSKNLFIFAALVFTGNLKDISLVIKTFLAFFIFCGLSGAVYIINDIRDKEEDKNHPLKKKRPIASGRLELRFALLSSILIALLSLSLSFFLPLNFRLSALAYLLLMTSYILLLREIVIVDVITVSLGFVLRLLAGGFAISILSTFWSMILTFFLAIFISLVKRRAEKIALGEKAIFHRSNLRYYNKETLDYLIIISATNLIISYVLFTIFSGKNVNLCITIPFVIFGIFRYIYLAFEYNSGEEPSLIFIKDRPLFYNILFWVLISTTIIYLT